MSSDFLFRGAELKHRPLIGVSTETWNTSIHLSNSAITSMVFRIKYCIALVADKLYRIDGGFERYSDPRLSRNMSILTLQDTVGR